MQEAALVAEHAVAAHQRLGGHGGPEDVHLQRVSDDLLRLPVQVRVHQGHLEVVPYCLMISYYIIYYYIICYYIILILLLYIISYYIIYYTLLLLTIVHYINSRIRLEKRGIEQISDEHVAAARSRCRRCNCQAPTVAPQPSAP